MSKSSMVLLCDALDASEEPGSWTDLKIQHRQRILTPSLTCVRSGSGMIPGTVALAVIGSCDCCSANAS